MRQKRPTGMMDLIRDRTMSPAVNNKKKFAGLIGMKLNGIVLVNSTQNPVTMDRRTIEHRQPMYYRWYLDGRLFFAAQYNHSLHSMLPDWTFFPSFLFSFFSPLFSSTSSLSLALSLFFSFFLLFFFSLRVVFFFHPRHSLSICNSTCCCRGFSVSPYPETHVPSPSVVPFPLLSLLSP